jgi:membrane-associated phospholipid phosphatase
MPNRPRLALFGAGACVVLLALVWLAAFHIGVFRHADQSAYQQFGDLRLHGSIAWATHHLVSAFEPDPYVYLVLVPLIVALLRGRPRVVLAIGVIVLGANASTEMLKHLVAAPRPGSLFGGGLSPLPPASWPSGHSTAAMSLVLATVLAVPNRLRPAAASLGAVLAIGVGYAVVAGGLHYPSDVFGGYLVAATWALTVVAGLLAAEELRPLDRTTGSPPVSLRAVLGAPGAVVVGAALLFLALVAVHPHDVVAYARVHQAFVFEAAGIAAVSLAVSTAVLLSVRR